MLQLRGGVYPRSNDMLFANLMESVVNPTGNHQIQIESALRQNYDVGGLVATITLVVDGLRKPLYSHIFTLDELLDAYEVVHHQVHGYDARGLDPRTQRTRLTVDK